jgi:hypothetical protein
MVKGNHRNISFVFIENKPFKRVQPRVKHDCVPVVTFDLPRPLGYEEITGQDELYLWNALYHAFPMIRHWINTIFWHPAA